MSWLLLPLPGRSTRKVERIGREIAEHSRAAVHARLSDITWTMGLSEVRGYIRARAGQPIRREVRFARSGAPQLMEEVWDRVIRRATEYVVHAVIRDLLSEPVPALQIRKAA